MLKKSSFLQKHYQTIKYLVLGTSLAGVMSLTGVLYYYPELRSTPIEALKASKRLWNVTYAGIKIAWIYKTDEATEIGVKHHKASKILKDAFYSNGGLWIKFGQIIGALDTLVPKEYQANLSSLNTECPRDSFEKVKQVVEEETGKRLEQLFLQFEETPIASASIAQVHKAKLHNGQPVAVKVQHLGLAESTRFDIGVLRMCISLGEYLFENFNYRWLAQETERNLPLELDFRQEASNLQKCRQMLKEMKNVLVPRIEMEPKKRVLVMEYMYGVHMSNSRKIEEQGINKEKLRKLISQTFIKMIFIEGFVHADPHAGNILARRKVGTKDEPEIVLLDHGIYQTLDPATLHQYCRLWMGIFTNDNGEMIDAATKLGTKNPRLFCSMLTAKRPQELNSKSLKKLISSDEETKKILAMAADYHNEIVKVLNEVNRSLLLVFKVNDFAKNLQNSLGGRNTDYYLEVAKGCFVTLQTPWWRRWLFILGYYYQKVFG